MNGAKSETQIAYHRRRLEELKSNRNLWEDAWQGVADFIEPTRYRTESRDERSTKRDKIVDATGTFALRTLQSGMHSGITSPARPWFRLTTFDTDMRNFQPVKEYLSAVEERMREVFQASNVYNAFHTGYGDLGQFGQSMAILAEDEDATVRMQPLVHGEFWIERDERGMATTLYRRFYWSVQKIVSRFGYKACSRAVQSDYDTARYSKRYTVYHAIEPRLDRNPNSPAARDKPFLSNYWEDCGDGDRMLQESGFDGNPIIGPAWELSSDDNYGLSPGQIALSDIKMLQKEQTRKLEGIDKLVRPPMTGPTSMRNNPASLLPGAITYVDDPTGKGYRPAMEVNLRLAELAADIRETQERIRQTFYADLFLMLSQMEGIQPRNQLEIAERKEEKLLALGPVLENIYNGQLEPVIDRTFQIMARRGMLPPPPVELRGQDLKIEYISMLAQAQKAVATGGIERFAGFVGNLAAVKPDVLDKFDADDAADHYAEMLGVPPSIVVADEEVEKIRKARAQKQQQAEQAAMASEMAPAAKAGAEAASVLASAGQNPNGASLLQQIGLA